MFTFIIRDERREGRGDGNSTREGGGGGGKGAKAQHERVGRGLSDKTQNSVKLISNRSKLRRRGWEERGAAGFSQPNCRRTREGGKKGVVEGVQPATLQAHELGKRKREGKG